MSEADVASELVRNLIEKKAKLPTQIQCLDGVKSYYVVISEAKNFQIEERSVKGSIGGGGGRCGCCDGTGRSKML